MKNTSKKLKELVIENKTSEVLKELRKIADSSQNNKLINDIVIQSSKYNEYKSSKRRGTETFENLLIGKSRMDEALLEIIDLISTEEITIYETNKKQATNKYALFTSLGILIALATLILYLEITKERFELEINAKAMHSAPDIKNGVRIGVNQSVIFKDWEEMDRLRKYVGDPNQPVVPSLLCQTKNTGRSVSIKGYSLVLDNEDEIELKSDLKLKPDYPIVMTDPSKDYFIEKGEIDNTSFDLKFLMIGISKYGVKEIFVEDELENKYFVQRKDIRQINQYFDKFFNENVIYERYNHLEKFPYKGE